MRPGRGRKKWYRVGSVVGAVGGEGGQAAQGSGEGLFDRGGEGGVRVGGRAGGGLRADVAAAVALDLAEAGEEEGGAAAGAAVQVRLPVPGELAFRADQHLALVAHAAFPGARATGRIG